MSRLAVIVRRFAAIIRALAYDLEAAELRANNAETRERELEAENDALRRRPDEAEIREDERRWIAGQLRKWSEVAASYAHEVETNEHFEWRPGGVSAAAIEAQRKSRNV
jgi:hypothetical protein